MNRQDMWCEKPNHSFFEAESHSSGKSQNEANGAHSRQVTEQSSQPPQMGHNADHSDDFLHTSVDGQSIMFSPSSLHRSLRADELNLPTSPLPPWTLVDQNSIAQALDIDPQTGRKRGRPAELSPDDDVMIVHKKRHNAIEQRRREKINVRINELKTMLPAMYHSAHDKAAPKAQILSDAIMYVQDVQARFRSLGIRDLIPESAVMQHQPTHSSVLSSVLSNPHVMAAHSQAHPRAALMGAAAAAAAAAASLPQSSDESAQYKSNLISLLRNGQRVDVGVAPNLLHKQLQHLHRTKQISGNPDDPDDQPVDTGMQYSSEILRLLLNAAGREGGEHDPEMDPFSMEEGDHAFVENIPDKRARECDQGHNPEKETSGNTVPLVPPPAIGVPISAAHSQPDKLS